MTVGGAIATKPARMVDPGEPVLILGDPPRFVSRGGEKLDAALDGFTVAVEGRRALDAGSSTGGFTDCLLQRGCASVIAVDVGRGQLHPRMREDPRVTVRERTDIRTIDLEDLGGPVDLVVGDLSFISLRTVLDALLALVRPGGDLVLLVKPQFEVGRAEASRGKGVIRDPEVRAAALADVRDALTGRGAVIMGEMTSPLKGGAGNVEFLVHARAPRPADGQGRVGPASPAGGGGHRHPGRRLLARGSGSRGRAARAGRPPGRARRPRCTRGLVRRGPGPRGQPRWRRHDVAHGQPGGGPRRARPRRELRSVGLPHRDRPRRPVAFPGALLRRRLPHRGAHAAGGAPGPGGGR